MARKEIGHVYRGLRNLRALFIADVVILGIMFLFSLAADHALAQVITGVMCATALAGSILVVQQPYLWSIVLALGHSILAALGLVTLLLVGPNLFGVVTLGLAVMLWLAVKSGTRAHRLLKHHPDAWAGGRATYSGRQREEIDSKWADRAREAKQKRTRNILMYVLTPVVLLVLAVVFFKGPRGAGESPTYTPPAIVVPTAPLAPTASRFPGAWNTSDLDRVMDLVLPAERDRLRSLTAKVIRRRAWTGSFPAASEARFEEYDARSSYAWHDLEGYGTLRVSWQWSDGAWWIVRVKYKKDD